MLITDYMNYAAQKWPNKDVFIDEKRSICYSNFQKEAYKIAMAIIQMKYRHKPIAIFLSKSVECIVSFLGVACSGNFYTPLDTEMPIQRIRKILETLHPQIIITDSEHQAEVKKFADSADIVIYEDAQQSQVDISVVRYSIDSIIDTDILYVLFTSGSTGIPKGVIISHRAVVDFIEWGAECFEFDDSIVIGNQTPLYFSMSVFDVYQTLRNGGTMYIIPHTAFSFPIILMEYLFDHHINMIYWVPSALNMVSALDALNMPHLLELKRVLFGGEVMPMKQLNRWREAYPDVLFVNMYGPTEVTDTCTYYIVDRSFEDTEPLPMGFACKNMNVFLLNEDGDLIYDNQLGEVCVRGTGLAYGYYQDPERTKENFVQNPLHNAYTEMIYRTGDLAQYNEYGQLVYISRKDFQIKHMGHRIELGEIETAAAAVNGVEIGICTYDSKHSRIVLFYTGSIENQTVAQILKTLLPEYMVPNKYIKLESMPLNLNGKVDRQRLKDFLKK